MVDSFTKDKFAWLNQVAGDHHLQAPSFKVAYILSQYFNRSSGEAWPSLETLAAGCGRSVRRVQDSITDLLKHEHLQVDRGNKGRSNRYKPITKDVAQSDENVRSENESTGQNCPVEIIEPDKTVRSDQTEVSDVTGQKCPPIPLNEPIEETFESKTLEKASSKNGKVGFEKEFAEFWNAFPNKQAKGVAEKAFQKARTLIDHQTIMAGVMRYAAERTDQNPKYTRHPATWLNGKCWADEHPPAFVGESIISSVFNALREDVGSTYSAAFDLEAEDVTPSKPTTPAPEERPEQTEGAIYPRPPVARATPKKEVELHCHYPALLKEFHDDAKLTVRIIRMGFDQQTKASALLAKNRESALAFILSNTAEVQSP